LSEGVKKGSATELSTGLDGCGCGYGAGMESDESITVSDEPGAAWDGAAISPEEAGAGVVINPVAEDAGASRESPAAHELSTRAMMSTSKQITFDFFIVLPSNLNVTIVLRIY